MKKVIFFALFMGLIIFSLFSCKKEVPLAPRHIPDVKLDKDYDRITGPDRQSKI